MFTILERYIAKTILYATLLISLVIGGLLVLLALLSEAKNYGIGDYGLISSFIYVALQLSTTIYRFSPLLILLGCVMGLGTLAQSRELTVMRAYGLSMRKIIRSVIFAALLIVSVLVIMGEVFGPRLSYQAEVYKENAKNAGQAVVTASGIWLHIDNSFIHVQRVIGRQLLKGVTRFEFDTENRLQTAYYGDTLTHTDQGWEFHDVVKTSFYEARTKSQVIASMPWELKMNENLFNIGFVNPNEMSLLKLTQVSRYLAQNGLQNQEYMFNFWRRIFQPLASIVMVLLAIPFVLGAFKQSNMGLRLIVGLMLGFVFFIGNAILAQLCVVYQIPTFFAALFPPLLFALLAFVLARRMLRY